MKISKTKFVSSIVSSVIATALILVPFTINRTKKNCKKELDRSLRENDMNAKIHLDEVQKEFCSIIEEQDDIINRLISLNSNEG